MCMTEANATFRGPPDELVQALNKLIWKLPKQRRQSFDEFAEGLAAEIADIPPGGIQVRWARDRR